jgi:hypothetical protein
MATPSVNIAAAPVHGADGADRAGPLTGLAGPDSGGGAARWSLLPLQREATLIAVQSCCAAGLR